MFKDFNPGIKQIFATNKMAFETAYQTMCTFQNQAEELSNMMIRQFNLSPLNLQKIQSDWLNLVKKERDNWKKTIDMGYQSLEKMFTFETTGTKETASTKETTGVKETKSASEKTSESTSGKKSEEKRVEKAEESSKKPAQEKSKSSA